MARNVANNPPLAVVGPNGQAIGIGSINTLGARDATTVAGNAATKILATPTLGRDTINLHNCDATYELWGRYVATGAAVPTVSSTNRDFVVLPKGTLALNVTTAVDVYIQNSTGAATTTNYTALEGLS